MDLRISQTGIRNGEFITSSPSGKQCEGTIMQVRLVPSAPSNIAYPPSRFYASQLDDLVLRDHFNNFKFFASMSISERRNWLLSNSTEDNDLYMNAVPGLQVRFVKVDFAKVTGKKRDPILSPEQIDTLIHGNPEDAEGYWPLEVVYQLFPKNPRSRSARYHTLVFRPANWSLMITSSGTISSYSGLCVLLETGDLANATLNGSEYDLYPVQVSETMAQYTGGREGKLVIANRKEAEKSPMTLEMLKILIGELLAPNELRTFDQFSQLIAWFPPSMYKSLIQKMYRIRPIEIEYASVLFPVRMAILCAFSALFVHSGSFVPNIQRYVSGAEAALKRGAVSIIEDAYLADGRRITSLLAGAWIAQNAKNLDLTFVPSRTLMKIWMQSLLDGFSEKMYKYDWNQASHQITSWTPWAMNYLLLDTIKSFHTDISMVSSINDNGGISSEEVDTWKHSRVMPLIHCLDHHSFTDIGWFVNPGYVSQGYGPLFNSIWDNVVGVNSRKWKYNGGLASIMGTMSLTETSNKKNELEILARSGVAPILIMMAGANTENLKYCNQETVTFIRNIQEAQRFVWINQIHTPEERPVVSTERIEMEYNLDPSWLAALIGAVEFRIENITAYAVIRPDNIYEFTAVKKPIRGPDKEPELTENQKGRAITMLKEALFAGIKVKFVPKTLPELKEAVIIYREIGPLQEPIYYVALFESTGYRTLTWTDYIKIKLSFSILNNTVKPEQYLENALLYTGNGVEPNAETSLTTLLQKTERNILRRSIIYLDGSKSEINLYKISRDGSGTEYSVLPEDTGVNHLFAGIASIYPAALVKTKKGYEVKSGPLFWIIVDKIRKYYVSLKVQTSSDAEGHSWGKEPLLPEKRHLWEHQIEAVEKLHQSKGKHGNIIWITAGLGKTLIITSYICDRINLNTMYPYCVYCLPPSAMETVSREFELRGILYVHLDTRQAAGGLKRIEPYVVNLIFHDHLRIAMAESTPDWVNPCNLKDIAPQCLIIFDEFHKMLASTTQRTSVALELAKLSGEFIAMTGTLIKDSNAKELIEWLSMIVDFEVNETNYFVAIASLISRKIETKVIVEHSIVEQTFTDDEKKRYYECVPYKLGGTSPNIDFKRAVEISYEAITRGLLEQTMFYLSNRLGVFLVARNVHHAELLASQLRERGVNKVLIIGHDNSVSFTPKDADPFIPGSLSPYVVITRSNFCEGYNMTLYRIMVQGVYFSNEATRQQLEKRINRIDQTAESIRIITIHSGIISFIFKKYEHVHSIAMALKGFAKEVDLGEVDMTNF